MRNIVLTIMAATAVTTLFAQSPNVKVYDTTSPNNSFSIIMEPEGFGYFTIWLDIIEAVNTETPKSITRIINDKSTVTFQPIDKSKPVGVQYTYNWLHGKVNSTPTEGFVYSLPVRSGSEVTIKTLTPPMFGVMNQNISKLYAFRIYTNGAERVCAMRDGIVTEVEGSVDMRKPSTIIIEHTDGTRAEYRNIYTTNVVAGNMVSAQTFLGTSGTLSDGQMGVDIAVYRYIDNNNKITYPQAKTRIDYINPLFKTSKGNITLEDGKRYTADVQMAVKKDISHRCSCGKK